jgi:hypothetical protein
MTLKWLEPPKVASYVYYINILLWLYYFSAIIFTYGVENSPKEVYKIAKVIIIIIIIIILKLSYKTYFYISLHY